VLYPRLKVARSRPRKKPLNTIAAIVSLFILLSAASQGLSLYMMQSVFAYYSRGSAGGFDGMITNCNRAWQNYVLADEVTYLPTLCNLAPSRAYYPVTLAIHSKDQPGLVTYPIYKTESMILLQKGSTNTTSPFNIFGVGNDTNTDNLLKDALKSGYFPSGNDKYQAVVTDFVAGNFGFGVGDQLRIIGLYRDTGGNFSTAMFSETITISGILSESKLNAEFNVAGVPVFTSGGYGPQTAYAAGVRPASCIGSASEFFTYSDLHQAPVYAPCQLSPRMFVILGNNFLRYFYGGATIGPSEVLFRFSPPPSGPNELLDRFNRISNLSTLGLGNEVSMLWRSNVALIGPGLLQSIQTFNNATTIANSNITADDLELGIAVSPVIDRLQTIANQTLLLVASASILGAILELAIFLILSPKLALEIEVYKANGLGTLAILNRMFASHSLYPIGMVALATSAVIILGILANSSMIFPVLLGLAFASLVLIEFASLVRRVMSHKEFRPLSKGRVG
jgi:hypothetical protein